MARSLPPPWPAPDRLFRCAPRCEALPSTAAAANQAKPEGHSAARRQAAAAGRYLLVLVRQELEHYYPARRARGQRARGPAARSGTTERSANATEGRPRQTPRPHRSHRLASAPKIAQQPKRHCFKPGALAFGAAKRAIVGDGAREGAGRLLAVPLLSPELSKVDYCF